MDYRGRLDLARGIRNNNPGNLIYTAINWVGKVPLSQNTDTGNRFEQFTDIKYGIRAAALDIYNDVKQKQYTLRQLMYEYCPPPDNTEAYIRFVSDSTGLAPNEPVVFDYLTLTAVLAAVFSYENGSDAQLITNSDLHNSIALLPQLILKELSEFVQAHPVASAGGAALVIGITTLAIVWAKRRAA